ncbi:hypothetical protein AVEN_274368-1 [Araneus ventricosus]|uniref:Uncharacterized protein n=1 Tax=Araneus ventricosus TaxID=182803 RepID=A0A4Y2MKU4_ARAVE|nr:hypothetical protein AVEN_274368-1 [Araneus ventricosus]
MVTKHVFRPPFDLSNYDPVPSRIQTSLQITLKENSMQSISIQLYSTSKRGSIWGLRMSLRIPSTFFADNSKIQGETCSAYCFWSNNTTTDRTLDGEIELS